MMAITLNGSYTAAKTYVKEAYGGDPYREPKKELGKDDFLKLLITELQYQDIMSSQGDKEFIAQMAQFSSLEQMSNLSATMEKFIKTQMVSQSAGLIGKEVEALSLDQSQLIKGIVTGTYFEEGAARLIIDDHYVVDLQDVISTGDRRETNLLSRASVMIGRNIVAEAGESEEPVSGKVTGAEIDNGLLWLIIDGETRVLSDDVVKISI